MRIVYFPQCNASAQPGNATYITIRYPYPPLPPCVPNDDCNYICYGTFEESDDPNLWHGFLIYEPIFDYNTADLWNSTGAVTCRRNVIDNYWADCNVVGTGCEFKSYGVHPHIHGGNQFMGIYAESGISVYSEGFHFKLKKPIYHDTTKRLKLKFLAKVFDGCASNFKMIAVADDTLPLAPPNPIRPLVGPVRTCALFCDTLGTLDITSDTWAYYSIPIALPKVGDSFTDIIIMSDVALNTTEPTIYQHYCYFDNFEIYDSLATRAVIASNPHSLIPCNDTTQTIEYYVCLENSIGVNSDSIIVQVNLPYGFTIASGSDFDATGRYKIPAGTISNTFCDTLKLKYNIDITKVATDRGHTITAGYTCHAYCVSEISDWVKVYPKNHAIAVTKSVNKPNPIVGDTIIFTYVVSNISPLAVSDILFTDTFPSQLIPIQYQTGPTLNGQLLSYQISLDSAFSITSPRFIQFSTTAVVKSNCKIPTQAQIKSIANPCFKAQTSLNLNDTSSGSPVVATIKPLSAVWCGNNIPLQAVITNPSGTYTYQWQKDGTNLGTNSASHLATSNGLYSVKISQNGCVSVISSRAFDTAFIVTDKVTHTRCAANIGSIYVTPRNGVKPYTYSWSGASSVTDSFRISLPSGSYTVTVTDSNGCNQVLSFTINRLYDTLSIYKTITHPKCTTSNGSISILSNGGSAPHNYVWNGGSTLQSRSGLSADTFYVTVSDTNGCFIKDTTILTKINFTITVNDSMVNPQCGLSTGSIYLKPSGGYSNYYTYQWSNGMTQSNILNVSAKSYYVTVADTMGCEVKDTILLLALADSNFKTKDSLRTTLCKDSSGAIYLYNLTGTSPYKFLWNTGDTLKDLIGLDSGVYTVKVTDKNNCILHDTFYVPRLEDPINFNFFNDINCNLGLATFTVEPTSGIAPYKILWNDSDTSRVKDSMSIGSYTVKVSDKIGCYTTMDVHQSFTNTIILDKYIIQPNCGMSGSIRVEPVTGKAPFTYLWNNGSTDSLRTNLTNGTYLVTVTDSFGCVTKDTITLIDQNPSTMQATIQSTVSCVSGTNSSLKAIPTVKSHAYKYLWNTGDTTQSISVANNGQRYTVTITDVSNNCRKSFSEVPHQDSFIKLGTNYNINNYNDALALGILNSSTLDEYNLVIGGTFTITENIDWKNCDIVLESGASIEFPIGCSVPTDMVIMHNNNIYTCGDQLARGLSFIDCIGSQTMGSYTDLYLDFKENNVRDCYKGIEIERALFPNLVNNQFVNNMIGIHFNPSDFFVCTPFARLIYLPQNYQQFYGNKFYTELVSGVGKVKKPYSGIQFDEYSHTGYNPLSWINMGVPYGMGYAGLVAEKTAEFNIGNTQQLKNSFENLLNGVLLYGTSTSIVNSTFSDIHYKHLPTSTHTAIRAKGNPNSHLIGKLTVYGYGKTVQSEDMFKNVYSGWGIVLDDLEHAHIEKVKMKDVGAGVTSTVNHSYALNKIFRLKDSRFYGTTSFAHGGLLLNDYTLDNFFAVVDNNEFYDLSACAIRANKATKSFNNSWLYVTNNVMRGNTVHGIDINGYPSVGTQRRVEVRGNNLKFTGNKFYTGIHYYYSQNVLSKENTVKGSFSSYPYPDRNFPKFYPVGIYHNNSTGFHTCNMVDSMYTGTRFFMNCNNTDWKQNKTRNHFQGLNIGSNSSLKQQFKAGNSFTGTCNVEAISHQVAPTQFYVSNPSADYMPSPRFPVSPIWWSFIPPTSSTESDNCSGIISFSGGGEGLPIGIQGDFIVWRDGIYNPKGQNGQLIYGLELTSIDTTILTNTMTFNSFQPELTWQYRKDLYDKVKPFESELRDTSIFRDYLSQMEDGTINEFIEMNVIEQQSIEEMNASAVQIETLRHAIDSGWRQMVVLDSLVESAGNASQRAQRIQDRNLLTQWIRSQDSQLHVIVLAADSNNSEYIQQVQDIMDTLIPEGLSDSLSQVFHQLYYHTIGQGNSELSLPQYQTYQAIAAQCPFINVEAVYRSRIILMTKGDTTYYNDSLICSAHGIIVKSAKPLVYKPKTKTPITYKVYPNPSSDIIHIQISEVLSKKLRFVVNDILGREVYNEIRDMNSNRQTIDGSHWENGIYSLRILDSDNTIFKTQIQIRK